MLVVPGPVWSPAVVLALVALVVVWRWARSVLTDVDRYVAATSHLPRSVGVRRLSGWMGGHAVVRTARRRGLSGAPGVGVVERWVARRVPAVMGHGAFATGWSLTHRLVHVRAVRARALRAREGGGWWPVRRGVTRGPVASRPIVVTLAMLLLAAGGEVVGRIPRRVGR